MAFITRCWKSALLALWLLLPGCAAAWADAAAAGVELKDLRVERAEGSLLLSAQLRLDLPDAVIETLEKGIPVHFVVAADVVRQRWYWFDQTTVSARRYMRVVYLPLTRRWRVNMASNPVLDSGLGVSYAQNFDTLDEALAAISRIARWRISALSDIDEARQTLHFSFMLDTQRLPRALQLGVAGRPEWNVGLERNVDLAFGDGQ
ncbi:MAG: DUF4390 domain-containing protein [Burkholderiaceae bacterium]|jgi:hypothetical protein|nr:DUF4390 domain-containing protein [Burkholderiaceae bacterium]